MPEKINKVDIKFNNQIMDKENIEKLANAVNDNANVVDEVVDSEDFEELDTTEDTDLENEEQFRTFNKYKNNSRKERKYALV